MKPQAEEILNLSHNRAVLIVKALNRSDTRKQAARKLGVTLRTVDQFVADYSVKRNRYGRYHANIKTFT
jgi:hypothetical protein